MKKESGWRQQEAGPRRSKWLSVMLPLPLHWHHESLWFHCGATATVTSGKNYATKIRFRYENVHIWSLNKCYLCNSRAYARHISRKVTVFKILGAKFLSPPPPGVVLVWK